MRVTILKETKYEPVSGDARSCFGQLAKRASRIETEVVAADGTKTTQSKVGPMEHFFPKGRTPELRDEVATAFIARGVAERYDGEPVTGMDGLKLLAEMAVKTE